MANMEVILLERIDSLGVMGDRVKVKPGYARNYLLPQKKALRATPDNVAYFEAQKADLEKRNAERRADAEKLSKSIAGKTVTLIRLASEAGHLYGSVTTRDISDAIVAQLKTDVARNQIVLNNAFKTLGLLPVTVSLHPEVKVSVTVNVARSEEEAAIQLKTGKALVAETRGAAAADSQSDKSSLLDDEAIALEQEWAADEAAKEGKKAAKKAAKAAKVEDEAANDADAPEGETA